MAELTPAGGDKAGAGANDDAEGEQDNGRPDNHPVNDAELCRKGRDVHDQIQQVEFEGQMVYATLVQNMVAARYLLDMITPHLPQGNQETALAIRKVNTLLAAAAMHAGAESSWTPSASRSKSAGHAHSQRTRDQRPEHQERGHR